MSDKPEAQEPAKPAGKRKKILLIVAGVLLALVLAGGGAFYYIAKQRAAAADDGEETVAAKSAHDARKTPPSYLPMESMVVNLADPGGERVAQVGVTLEVSDAHATDTVKAYMPTIRSGVLMLISRRTAEELLSAEGKDKLAKDILRETLKPFGGGDEVHEGQDAPPPEKKKKDKSAAESELPVRGVLFSSFIVQ